ncbi:pyridoxamine 5'-phosphate oxidase family protein [Cribrihabitans neustonicus]|uniref:pyridoxamine 5'-phosphate oxidase family protein n=1 Tax=Cribrihabitans neustonicus TaxID=1429085 RepID=UPI003B5D0337
MSSTADSAATRSPFHEGEQTLQAEAGKREAMEAFGRRVIRSFMPEQHQAFYAQLPFLAAGAVDAEGWPWAGLLAGEPGFAQAPDARRLRIGTRGFEGDPLAAALKPGAPLGLLGIELHSRRRNRLNGRISALDAVGLELQVDQSFGNCPQYIQHRELRFLQPQEAGQGRAPHELTRLDAAARAQIETADMFFAASCAPGGGDPVTHGADVSHRGGRPGFVKVDGNTLTIPDFPGNHHFNTFGNFLLMPRAGLLFPDFETGDVLTLTGTVELLAEGDPALAYFRGAGRGWRFTLSHGRRLPAVLPFRANLGAFSPNTLMTGTWAEAAAQAEVDARRGAWRSFRVAEAEQETPLIRSLYLEPADGAPLLPFKAGQFLTLKVSPEGASEPMVRTYTVSSAPGDPHYRISVKREAGGAVSGFLHDGVQPGDTLAVKAPRGAFRIDAAATKPAVLLAGGVGVTPMIAMARHLAEEAVRTRHLRPLTVLHAARTKDERAFLHEFQALETATGGRIRYVSVVSGPAAGQGPEKGPEPKAGQLTGRIDAEMLRGLLALDDYEFFLCGSPGFTQTAYDSLRELGVRDDAIRAEAFGPAALKRAPETAQPSVPGPAEAKEAVVHFTRTGAEQRWTAEDGPLLDFAEAHGLTPDFSCRSGSCGSCAVKLRAGEVTYRTPPAAHREPGEALLCCAVPAAGTDRLELDL